MRGSEKKSRRATKRALAPSFAFSLEAFECLFRSGPQASARVSMIPKHSKSFLRHTTHHFATEQAQRDRREGRGGGGKRGRGRRPWRCRFHRLLLSRNSRLLARLLNLRCSRPRGSLQNDSSLRLKYRASELTARGGLRRGVEGATRGGGGGRGGCGVCHRCRLRLRLSQRQHASLSVEERVAGGKARERGLLLEGRRRASASGASSRGHQRGD